MRVTVARLVVLVPLLTAASVARQDRSPSPGELVRMAVENELKPASNNSPRFIFCQTKESPYGSSMKLMVQTNDAMAGILVSNNGKPLGPKMRQAEGERLDSLARDRDALEHKRKQEKEDEARVNRIVRALPDAFLFEANGSEVGTASVGSPGDELIRLEFRPNPNYDPPTRTEQVLQGMRGHVLIDKRANRIAQIDGTLFKEVGFGWGILGHLDKGGHFLVEQAAVGEGEWAISHMSLSFTGKVLLFKSLNIKTNEVYTDFRPAPANLTFAQGVELLKQQSAELAKNQRQGGDPR